MPVKISPLKILTDLGYEMVDIETDEDYLSALMESIVSLQGAGGSGRARADILQEELIRVRKERKAAAPSAGMKVTQKKISTSKFFDKKEKKPDAEGKGGAIIKIGNSVTSIVETLKEEQKQDKKQQSFLQKIAERFKRRKKENKLEFKVFDGLKKTATKLLAPMKNAWNEFLGFIGKVILGRVLFKILEWMGDKENQGKLKSIIKFFQDWWPAMLAGYLLFGNSLTSMVTGMLITMGKWLAPMLLAIGKLMLNPLVAAAVLAGGTALYLSTKKNKTDQNVDASVEEQGSEATAEDLKQEQIERDEERNPVQKFLFGTLMGEDAERSQQIERVEKMNKGGTVPGSGNTDTVPAMLTPGEFVMSKGAVQKYGANTLAGMNAAAGGTNRPTLMGGYNEGGKAADRSHFGTEGYRMGQVRPEMLVYSTEKFISKYKEKDGKIIEDSEDYKEIMGSIGMPDLIEHQTQLVDSIRRVPGYEDINFMDVIQYPDDKGRLVGMPKETLYPIFNASDAYKATDARRDEAIRIDMESGTQFIDTGMNGGGLVQAFQGGGQVRQMGRSAAKNRANITPRKTATVITPSEKKKVTVAYQEEKQKMEDQSYTEKSEKKIPNFNVTSGRSPQKIKVLGISV